MSAEAVPCRELRKRRADAPNKTILNKVTTQPVLRPLLEPFFEFTDIDNFVPSE
jgi:hypothetical protein